MKIKVAFLDRDGVLIDEPQDDFQIDSLEKLKLLPGVIEVLQWLKAQGYQLVMISNQNGVGLPCFPTPSFMGPQERLLELFQAQGIEFEKIFICPHLPQDGCDCRKPKIGLVDYFLTTIELDRERSLMVGDRETDRGFAENVGIPFFKLPTNQGFLLPEFQAFVFTLNYF
ncbi:MAG: histidinol-phosphatase/imisazoleglycerol-phosphat e dehydratase [uncultured bacterium]|nr:MAG: histidinol-phosphatase/imisazoleglycerol-phosphat e dehydratase [uncultured bacterium]